uniref:Retrotransposon gag domain-containing protein n=1 Tax=Lactuca sativa TaxID=4236 RepID=A0A9R1X7S7_LACSA|nr:hypothetical protein LSAT_V11C600334800 [Lactuca sativa]
MAYLFLKNFMQLRKGKGDANSVIACKQREGESIRDYYDRFTLATLNVPGHEEFVVIGAFTQGLLPGPLSKKMQRIVPRSKDKITFQPTCKSNRRRWHLGRVQLSRRGKRVTNRNTIATLDTCRGGTCRSTKMTKGMVIQMSMQSTKLHQRRTRTRPNSVNITTAKLMIPSMMLKREIDEKQLVRNIVDNAKELRTNFNEYKHQHRNKKDGGKDHDKRPEMLTITGPHPCSNCQSQQANATVYNQNMLNIAFSMSDPIPKHWDPNDPLYIIGFISQKHVKHVVNVIYEHCLWWLPIEWKKVPPTTTVGPASWVYWSWHLASMHNHAPIYTSQS